MKKDKILEIISLVLVLLFAIFTFIDWKNYNEYMSAPFYLNIMIRFIEFIIPSIICLLISKSLNKTKDRKK